MVITGFDPQLAENPLFYVMIRKYYERFPIKLIVQDSLLLYSEDGIGGHINKDSSNENEKKIFRKKWLNQKVSLISEWINILKDTLNII
jgi:hypothetical protein